MTFYYLLQMAGIAAFAASGALAASRRRMDVFGFIVLALITAIGGGTVRDVIIDRTPIFWIADNRYIVVALITALIVYFVPQRKGKRRELLVWLDAMGLALFAAAGTQVSLAFNTGPLVAVILGVTTAVTGGMLRDIICNEVPLILSKEIYATAAFVSAITYVIAANYMNDWISLGVAVVAGFAIRASAIVYDWTLPRFGGGPRR